MAKKRYQRIGQITTNTDKEGKEYKQFVMHADFIENAKELVSHAYTKKNGDKTFYYFEEDNEKAPFLVANICVGIEE